MYDEYWDIISYLPKFHVSNEIGNILKEFIKYFSDKNFNINCLCNNLGMSYNEIYEKLVTHLNLCPSKILENIRMEYILAQLKEDNLSINRLSSKAGYSNVRTFRRAFKRCTGVSANECRIQLLVDDRDRTQYKCYLEKIWER